MYLRRTVESTRRLPLIGLFWTVLLASSIGCSDKKPQQWNEFFESAVQEDGNIQLNRDDAKKATDISSALGIKGPQHPRILRRSFSVEEIKRNLGVTYADTPDQSGHIKWRTATENGFLAIAAKFHGDHLVSLIREMGGPEGSISESVGASASEWEYYCDLIPNEPLKKAEARPFLGILQYFAMRRR